VGKEPITIQGKQKIEAELQHLIRVEREDLKHVIAEARALGDLKENAEYHAAKEKQSHLEGRIAQLQDIISRSEVIDIQNIKSNKIVFGAKVKLYDTDKDLEVSYQIVGLEESDLKIGKISYKSPLGIALIGKEVGDTILVQAPKGRIEYEVLGFSFGQET